MDGNQITKILGSNRIANTVFLGCFPCDRLPNPDSLRYPTALVINFDSYEKQGSHWVAVYAYGRYREVIYFDSLALPIPPLIVAFLKFFPNFKRNINPYQSPLTNTCAHFTIYFVYFLANGQSFHQFLHKLNIVETPDLFVKYFIKKLCDKIL